MADEKNDVDTSELDGIDDSEAAQLLADAADEGERAGEKGPRDEDAERLGDPGKRALAAVRAEKKAAEQKAADLEARLKKFEDKGKSELQRLTEERDQFRDSSTKAVSKAKALEIALDRAPAHATLAQVKAVAKRVRGDDDDSLERDADELFELLAPARDTEPKPGTKTPARPKERLKGGSADPDEDPEENDPRKLAALLPRRR